jgi:hypothetical protein
MSCTTPPLENLNYTVWVASVTHREACMVRSLPFHPPSPSLVHPPPPPPPLQRSPSPTRSRKELGDTEVTREEGRWAILSSEALGPWGGYEAPAFSSWQWG